MHKCLKGFTLIEVMVALAIFALVGISVMQIVSGQMANMLYLEQRLLSHWLGENLINELKLEQGKDAITSCDSRRKGEVDFVGQRWLYQMSLKPNPFKLQGNALTGQYGERVCQVSIELMLAQAPSERLSLFEGYLGLSQ